MKFLGQKGYEIDHFVPWSYITNDEMWNLMPVDATIKSSKKDKLAAIAEGKNHFRITHPELPLWLSSASDF